MKNNDIFINNIKYLKLLKKRDENQNNNDIDDDKNSVNEQDKINIELSDEKIKLCKTIDIIMYIFKLLLIFLLLIIMFK